MELAGSNLRNFQKSISPCHEMFDLPLESIDLMHQLGVVAGLLRRANQLETEQNRGQRIAQLMRCDREKIVADSDRLAQLFDQFVGRVGGWPGLSRLGIRLRGLRL